MSERTFWETYIPPFASAIDAGVGAVMPAFSAVNGSPPHASAWMLRDVLRDAARLPRPGRERLDRGSASSCRTAWRARRAMRRSSRSARAWTSTWPTACISDSLAFYARTDSVLRRDIDNAVRGVLRTKYALGLFTDPYHGASEARAARVTLSAAQRRGGAHGRARVDRACSRTIGRRFRCDATSRHSR